MRRTLLALGGVAMLATACGSSHPTTAPTIATAPAPTVAPTTAAPPPTNTAPPATAPTTTVPDTTVVPPTITVAYVDAVLAQLNHIYGDAVRATVKADRVTPATVRYIEAIYNKRLGLAEQGDFKQTVGAGLQNVRRAPGDPVTTVQNLVYASRTCIYIRVRTNSNLIVVHPVAPFASEFMGLQHPSVDPQLIVSHTPWVFFFDGVTKTPSDIPNQCPVR